MRAMPMLVPAFVSICAFGCGPSAYQRTLTVSAHAVVALDRELAPRYAEAAELARGATTTLGEYEARMAGWNAVEEGLGAVRSLLLEAQTDMDSVPVACILKTFSALGSVLSSFGIELPPALSSIIGALGPLGGVCVED